MAGVTAAAFGDWGRVKCPEGHANLTPRRKTETAYCKGCQETYDFADLVDTKREAVGDA